MWNVTDLCVVCLGLAVGSRMDLCSVQIAYNVKQEQYVAPHQSNSSTAGVGRLAYTCLN